MADRGYMVTISQLHREGRCGAGEGPTTNVSECLNRRQSRHVGHGNAVLAHGCAAHMITLIKAKANAKIERCIEA